MTQYHSNMPDFTFNYQRNQQIAEMEKKMALWRALEAEALGALEAEAAWRRAEQQFSTPPSFKVAQPPPAFFIADHQASLCPSVA